MPCRYHPDAGTRRDPFVKGKRICDKPLFITFECPITQRSTSFSAHKIPDRVPANIKKALLNAMKKNSRAAAKRGMKGRSMKCPFCGGNHSNWTIVTCNHTAD